LAAYREHARAERRPQPSIVDRVRVDVFQAVRAIRARPAATLATAAVLTLGIGLVSAMFALADPYLLRPLPYRSPNELVTLSLSTRALEVPPPTLVEWRSRHDV